MISKYREVTVEFITEEETSKGNVKEKTNKEKFLVRSDSVTESEERVHEYFKNTNMNFRVIDSKESKIVDVIEDEDVNQKI